MEKLAPTVDNVLAVLPSIQGSLRDELAQRAAAGEMIISAETPHIKAAIDRRRQARARALIQEHKSAA